MHGLQVTSCCAPLLFCEEPSNSKCKGRLKRERSMKKFVPLALTLMLSNSALAQTVKPDPGTTDFVTKAATSDMFEIASSKLAMERGNDATKAFAQQMI